MGTENNRSLDIRGVTCPLTWVKTKLVLEQMNSGELLEVKLDSEEAIRDVPKSAKSEGYKVIKLEKEDTFYRLWIKKED